MSRVVDVKAFLLFFSLLVFSVWIVIVVLMSFFLLKAAAVVVLVVVGAIAWLLLCCYYCCNFYCCYSCGVVLFFSSCIAFVCLCVCLCLLWVLLPVYCSSCCQLLLLPPTTVYKFKYKCISIYAHVLLYTIYVFVWLLVCVSFLVDTSLSVLLSMHSCILFFPILFVPTCFQLLLFYSSVQFSQFFYFARQRGIVFVLFFCLFLVLHRVVLYSTFIFELPVAWFFVVVLFVVF